MTKNLMQTQTKSAIIVSLGDSLLDIMEDHIGFENRVGRNEIFKQIYKYDYKQSDIQDWLRWDFIKKAMRFCRSKTNCFIIMIKEGLEYKFFVAKTTREADMFCRHLDKNIAQLKAVQTRVHQSINERWYEQSWDVIAPPKIAKRLGDFQSKNNEAKNQRDGWLQGEINASK